MTDYGPKYTPYPPKGNVKCCFVKINPNRYLFKFAQDLGPWATGFLRAFCNEDGTLHLVNLQGDRSIQHVSRKDVLRPYWP
jgi:hypothetical protein